MAKLVLIAAGTYRPGFNNIGDVVAIHEDSWQPGPAYNTFSVVAVAGYTKNQAEDALHTLLPADIDQFDGMDREADGTPKPQPEKYNRGKYLFRLTNPLGATLKDKVSTNVTLKAIGPG